MAAKTAPERHRMAQHAAKKRWYGHVKDFAINHPLATAGILAGGFAAPRLAIEVTATTRAAKLAKAAGGAAWWAKHRKNMLLGQSTYALFPALGFAGSAPYLMAWSARQKALRSGKNKEQMSFVERHPVLTGIGGAAIGGVAIKGAMLAIQTGPLKKTLLYAKEAPASNVLASLRETGKKYNTHVAPTTASVGALFLPSKTQKTMLGELLQETSGIRYQPGKHYISPGGGAFGFHEMGHAIGYETNKVERIIMDNNVFFQAAAVSAAPLVAIGTAFTNPERRKVDGKRKKR